MPYAQKHRLAARAHVDAIRARTFCTKCSGQPIEWHSDAHLLNTNRRIAHLVALGFPIPVIDAEIAKCEPLCRSCHMRIDGRTAALLAACPTHQKR